LRSNACSTHFLHKHFVASLYRSLLGNPQRWQLPLLTLCRKNTRRFV